MTGRADGSWKLVVMVAPGCKLRLPVSNVAPAAREFATVNGAKPAASTWSPRTPGARPPVAKAPLVSVATEVWLPSPVGHEYHGVGDGRAVAHHLALDAGPIGQAEVGDQGLAVGERQASGCLELVEAATGSEVIAAGRQPGEPVPNRQRR